MVGVVRVGNGDSRCPDGRVLFMQADPRQVRACSSNLFAPPVGDVWAGIEGYLGRRHARGSSCNIAALKIQVGGDPPKKRSGCATYPSLNARIGRKMSLNKTNI